MKRIIVLFLALLALIVFSDHAQAAARPDSKKGTYFPTGLCGTDQGDLQTLDITGANSPNRYDLIEGDFAVVGEITGEDVTHSVWVFDADGTDAEDCILVIRPNDFATAGVWRRNTDLGDMTISAGLSVPATISTNTTLTASQINGGIIRLSGDGTTVTMPAVSPSTVGKFVSFYVTDATAKHIDSNASDKHTLNGVATDDGDKLSIGAGNTGAIITLYCLDTDGWTAPKGTDGAFSDGGA